MRVKFLLQQAYVAGLVSYFDAIGLGMVSLAVLLKWEFLLRVQSEGLCFIKGDASDATSLPKGRDIWLWLDSKGILCLRLRRRKNRPEGSLLMRYCTCSIVGTRLCVKCRVASMALNKVPAGTMLWKTNASQFRNQVAEMLKLLRVEGAQ